VGRLVWIEWRRKRLALAERAAHMASLADRLDNEQRTLNNRVGRNGLFRGDLEPSRSGENTPVRAGQRRWPLASEPARRNIAAIRAAGSGSAAVE